MINDSWTANVISSTFTYLGAAYDNTTGRIYRTFTGAIAYVGASNIIIGTNVEDSSVFTQGDNQFIHFGIGVRFQPNFGKRKILFYVCYQLDDTYSLYVVKARGDKSKVLVHFDDLYFDNLGSIVEQTYDELIRLECDGFVPM